MFKYLFVSAMLICFSLEASSDKKLPLESGNSEFLELSEPEGKVSGAYYGLGIGLSRILNKLDVSKNQRTPVKYSHSANQCDLSVIIGFGAAFYEKYYVGIELDFFKRLPERKKKKDNETGIIHTTNFGLNMDVRFGYQIPKHGMLPYFTVGCSRITGKAEFYDNFGNRRRQRSVKKGFGSFYPTIGLGIEYKINHKWNLRGDLKYSITNKNKDRRVSLAGSSYKFDGKPNRIAFRLSVTRNI